MSNVIIFDENTGAVLQYLTSVNTPDYEGKLGVLINPDTSLLKIIPIDYTKVTGGRIVEMTPAEKVAVDLAKPIPEPSFEDKLIDLEKRVTALEKI